MRKSRHSLTLAAFSPRIRTTVRMLSVNIDHVATLRQARRVDFPDPVQLASLVEAGGAEGVTVHLRGDRRHINERDVELLRRTVKGELTVEMAATREMAGIAVKVKPDQVTLVPELKSEVTTVSGLDLVRRSSGVRPIVRRLKRAGIRLSVFLEPEAVQVAAAAKLGADVVELNTDAYCRDRGTRAKELARLVAAAADARESGLAVHVGHGLDYLNVGQIVELGLADGYSIGFAIIARALVTGLRQAVVDMKHILEVYS
jgi:pyridoxine 5-phosphate synthase